MTGVPLGEASFYYNVPLITAFGAETGGRGSWNPADTSRWGPGELREEDAAGRIVIPGTGGGATTQRRVPGSIFGGGSSRNEGQIITGGSEMRVPGSTPHGVVLVRLTRIAP